MAAILVLDWDRTSWQLVAADVNRSGVELHAATVWRPQQELSPGSAESLGKQLRAYLDSSGLKVASVLVGVGRDRVVLKEIAYPALGPQEEPALVRFQATKDLADAPEAVVVDYTPLTEPTSLGERRSLAVILRRDILTSFQQLCRAAGLKLLALVPRPFGTAGCLELARMRLGKLPEPPLNPKSEIRNPKQIQNPQEENPKPASSSVSDLGIVSDFGFQISDLPSGAVAVLLIGPRWAELDLLEGPKLLFSRSLPLGPSLPAEVRRSLVVFSNQPNGTSPRPAPGVLYLVGHGQTPLSVQSLQDTLRLPVYELDFLTDKEKVHVPTEDRSTVAACLGLLQSWSQKQVPINLASPREPAPVLDHSRRRRVLGGALAALVFLGAWIYGETLLAGKRAAIQSLEEDKAEEEARFQRLEPDRKDLDGLKEWDKGAIRWIDEFYDLVARFPHADGFRLTRIQIEAMSKRNPKDSFAARMTIQGVVPLGKEGLVHQFVESMRDPHLQARVERFRGQSFTIRVDLARQAARDYRTRFVPPLAQSTEGGKP